MDDNRSLLLNNLNYSDSLFKQYCRVKIINFRGKTNLSMITYIHSIAVVFIYAKWSPYQTVANASQDCHSNRDFPNKSKALI